MSTSEGPSVPASRRPTVIFYRAYDRDGRTNSVAAWTGHSMFVWVPNTERWHRNRSLEVDYLIDRELRYEEVDAEDVLPIIAAAKRSDERVVGWIIDEYRAQSDSDRRSNAELGL